MPTTSAGGRRCASGVKSTTSAKRMEAASKWSAIVWVAAFSRSAIELGRMFMRSVSDFSCSTRSAAERLVALVREGGEEREGDGRRYR